ncbi:MAG: amidohydrolase family protein [Halieaceae bacterium]|jgi:N-acyl-D-aspartate/D-glutamate deacylase|nr:amidohydrolase family protein [Halieaceae bacterium]MBT6182010.1 amidohydrolase family protein [Halieaceae bacterium]
MAQWDLLITGAQVFDGEGVPGRIEDVAIVGDRVAARGADLPRDAAVRCIDATGRWLLPGMLDIHTHLDLEVEVAPALDEVVRHGTTTVVVGNCSLGTCFGPQETEGQEPIVDCFTRVENIPKAVLRKCAKAMTWDNPKDYLTHFEGLNLGPNIAAFVPHSMLRIEVMGLDASISRAPTELELKKMEQILEGAMQLGYLGLSTDGLPFHYLSNDPHTDKRIPTQFASFNELRRLLKVVRKYDRVWQTTPIIENRLKALLYFTLTSGRLFGKPLKTSALSAMQMTAAPNASKLFLGVAKLLNSKFFDGRLHFQALGTNFRVWSDGIVSPLFEELSSTAELISLEYDDYEGRQRLMNDADWVARFRKEWRHGRTGGDFASWKAKRGLPDSLVIREPEKLIFDGAPCSEWDGESFAEVMTRAQRFKSGDASAARSEDERVAFEAIALELRDDADFALHMLRSYDKSFRFYADVANAENKATLEFLLHENTLPGFNDSGAHITNMAFFDSNLMSLKLAKEQGEGVVAQVVRRLTKDPAEVFGIDAGTLEIGARADMVIINPDALDGWEPDQTRVLEYREIFEHQQMVNRPEGIVESVYVAGQQAWDGLLGATDALGQLPLGRYLVSGGPVGELTTVQNAA